MRLTEMANCSFSNNVISQGVVPVHMSGAKDVIVMGNVISCKEPAVFEGNIERLVIRMNTGIKDAP